MLLNAKKIEHNYNGNDHSVGFESSLSQYLSIEFSHVEEHRKLESYSVLVCCVFGKIIT